MLVEHLYSMFHNIFHKKKLKPLKKQYIYFKISEAAIKMGIEAPQRSSKTSSGFYLQAAIIEEVTILAKKRVCIPTGIFIEQPEFFEAQIRSRVGLASNKGVVVLNAPATIDSDYKGEIRVILYNSSTKPVIIRRCEKIAIMVINELPNIELRKATI